jgi:uncharacterized membrane protein YcjF (UPF0283 family)
VRLVSGRRDEQSVSHSTEVEPLVDEGRLSRLQFWRKVQLGLVLAGAVLLVALSRPLFASDHWVRAVMSGIGILAIAAAVFGRLWSALYIGGRRSSNS